MLLALSFVFFKFDWASPSILIIGPYLISVAFLFLNKDEWQVSITEITYYVVFFGLFVTFVGDVFARIVLVVIGRKSSNCKNPSLSKINPMSPKDHLTNLVIFYMICFSLFYYFHVLSSVDFSGAVTESLLGTYRSSEKESNLVLKFFIVVNLPLAYLFLLSFIENYILSSAVKFKLLIPVIFYAATSILSSARIGILYLLVSAVLFFFITHQRKKMWRFAFSLKIVKNFVIIFLLTLALFYYLGLLTGKSNLHSFFYIISLYIGSSVAALDEFLSGFHYSVSDFGSETLIGVSNIFAFLGVDLKFANERILEFVHLGDMPSRTNIYTSFRRVVNDYGFFGIGVYHFLIGFLYSFLYQAIKLKKGLSYEFWLLIYVYFSQYLIFSFIDERILLNLLTLTTLVQIFSFYIFVRFLTDRRALNLDS
jgi:oligosaccharide repeat unit polymerase